MVPTSWFGTRLGRWVEWHAATGAQLAIARALVVVPAAYLVVESAARWGEVQPGLWLRLAATAAISVLGGRLGRDPAVRASARHWRVAAGVLLGGLALSAALYDTSWDGTSYHLPATLAIAEGWNPIAGAGPVQLGNWHSNGLWTIRAALVELTHSLEAGKAVNLVLALAALCALVPALAGLLGRPLAAAELVLSYLAVAGPTAAAQLFTGYVDGALYECGLVAIAAVLLAGSPHRRCALLLLAAALLLLVGSKLTGAYFALALPLAAAWAMRRRLPRPAAIAAVTLGAAALGALVIGYRPYVTNLLEHGRLVYLGNGGQVERPGSLAGAPPPVLLAAGVFGATVGHGGHIVPKLPGWVRLDELRAMGAPGDQIIGGFGPLFGLELVLAGTAAWLARREPDSSRGVRLGLAAGLAVTCAVFPEAWSARFVPFFWLVPLLLAPILGAAPTSRVQRLLAAAVLTLAAADSGLALTGNLAREALGEWHTRRFLAALAARHQEILLVPVPERSFEVTASYRLRAAGVPYRIAAPRLPWLGVPPECGEVLGFERIIYCLPAGAANVR